MINVNQITAQLARMPDQALQQYAQMHKSDPYTLSLALAESNRRKQMRQGAQMNAPEQPKVVDQELQGMAAPMPESVGIGQLPAGDMNFADGGIVAFGSGGDVPRYQSQGLVRLPGESFAEFRQRAFQAELDAERAKRAQERTASEAERQRLLAERGGMVIPPSPFMDRPPLPGVSPAASAVPAASATDIQQAMDAGSFARPAPAPAAPKADTGAAGAKGPGQRVPPAGGPGAVGPAPQQSLYDLATTPAQMKEAMAGMGIQSGVPAEIRSGITELQQAKQALADQNIAQIQAEQAARGPAFSKLEERLKEREGRVGKMEVEQGPMALLQAGLAIMGGTSPHALVNIGAGAQVGVKSYSEGLDKIERARDKLDESFAKIEEVRRNEGRMDAKELREAKNEALKPAIEAKQLGLSALEKNWGFDRQDATKGLDLLFKNRQTVVEQQGMDRRTAMQIQAQRDIAGMLPAELRGAMVLGTGKTEAERLRSGVPALMELKDRMTDTKIAELYTKHVADAKKDMSTPMTPEEFARTIRSAMGAYRPNVADVKETRAR